MFKLNKKVLVSTCCMIVSLAVILICLFSNDEIIQTETALKLATAGISREINIETIEVKNINNNEEIQQQNLVNEDITENNDNKDTNNEEKQTKAANEENISKETVENIAPAVVAIVYDGMTLDELASKLNRSLKNDLANKGYLYASYSLEKNVDPYLAVAISLEETGCNYNCSRLVKTCHNVGGMKGVGCGSYGYFNTLDEGIKAFIDNISKNYVAYGLKTATQMNSKYAENPAWSTNVNNYISRIKNN